MPLIDRILSDRYRLEGRLGAGGMATVYAGFDTVLRRRVAIKVLRPQFASDQNFVQRFYSEAQHVAKLAHPNVVNVYDVGQEGETYYIVMELVDGTTLAEMIEHDGRLPEGVAIDFAAQIASGLAYAHRQGILHRDIKPANILVTKDDVVKLSDFGIARAVTAQTVTMTQAGMVMGSVYYISPEQAQGHELGETSDLYSLGIVIYQMLTGKLPYTGESPITIALKHVTNPVPQLLPIDGEISPALAAIVRKLLQKNPAARFGSATEVASALREAREHPLITTPFDVLGQAPPPADVPGPRPRPSRNPDRRVDKTATRPIPTVSVEDHSHDEQRRPPGVMLLAGVIAFLLIGALVGYALFTFPGSPFAPASAPLADFTGQPVADVEKLLDSKGIGYKVFTIPSDSVPRDRVVRQDPPPNAKLRAGAALALYVSSGLPEIELLDVRQYSRDDAERYLRNAKLSPRIVERFDKAPKGTVLSQTPLPGSNVPIHSVITLIVSKGAKPAQVPDLVTMQLSDANAAVAQRGLRLEIGERATSDNIPEGVVVSQNPAPGSSVDAGSTIVVTVSAGAPQIDVPDVVGRSLDDALASLQNAGLKASTTYVVQANGQTSSVIDQDPRGTQVRKGSTVTLSVAVPGIVPDVSGMSLDQAKVTLENAGYTVGNIAYTQEGVEGSVVRTEPAASTPLRPGETVLIHVSGVPPGSGQ